MSIPRFNCQGDIGTRAGKPIVMGKGNRHGQRVPVQGPLQHLCGGEGKACTHVCSGSSGVVGAELKLALASAYGRLRHVIMQQNGQVG